LSQFLNMPPKPKVRSRLQENPAFWAALSGLVLLARYPDWIMRPRLWAEDGNVFFLHASRNWLADAFTPYAGYFHLLPRTLAWMGARLDPGLIPAFYVCSSLLLTLCVAALVFSGRLNLPCKPLLALAIVVVPATGEVFLTPTNIQWIAALSLVMTLLMRDPEGGLDWVCDILVLAAAGLTGPFSIFAAPFFLYRALARKTRASAALACVVAAAAIAQAWQLQFRPACAAGPHGHVDLQGLAAVLSSHLPLAFADAQAWVFRTSLAVVLVLGAVGFSLIGSACFIEDEFRSKRVQLLLFAAVVVGCTAAVIRLDRWDYREMLNADRYFYVPKVIVLWVAASCLHRRSRATRILASLGAAALLAASWHSPYLEGPGYAVIHEERPYYDWSRYVGLLRRGRSVELQTSPGWKFVVPERDSLQESAVPQSSARRLSAETPSCGHPRAASGTAPHRRPVWPSR
jgi:hypothetical protein